MKPKNLVSSARSKNMSAVKGKNTTPEIFVRKALHKSGFRYSLHKNDLPGKPDLKLPKYKAVIFVNGCFWHGHDCYRFTWPKTREDFWKEKITGNVERDTKNFELLQDLGWRVLIVWECAIRGKLKLPLKDLTTEMSEWIKSDSIFLEIRHK